MFWYSGYEACKILAPQPGIEPTSPALEAEVLHTGPPGKSQVVISVFLKASIIPEQVSTLDHQWGGKRARSRCIDLQRGLLSRQE